MTDTKKYWCLHFIAISVGCRKYSRLEFKICLVLYLTVSSDAQFSPSRFINQGFILSKDVKYSFVKMFAMLNLILISSVLSVLSSNVVKFIEIILEILSGC